MKGDAVTAPHPSPLPEERGASRASPLLRAEALHKRFSVTPSLLGRARGEVHAVSGVSLSIPTGTTLALVGESGCGKSTVGRLVLGLTRPTSGRVFLGDDEVTALSGERLRRLRRRMQMVFQDPGAALNPRMRIADAVAEGLLVHHPQLSRAERQARVAALLERVGLRPEAGQRRPGELSGGQRQRVVIARALAVEPELLVADEPTSALDVSVQAQVLNLLMELKAERGLTFLFISHDLRVVEHVADRVAVMYLGRLVEEAPRETLFARPRHPYTDALLSAVPDPRPGRRRARVVLDGDVPSPLSPPPGCVFHPRCPLYARLTEGERARCRGESPELRTLDDGVPSAHVACHFAERM
ncbi:MAG: ATP-binding cassette domain-containing protein [Myxococcaceae bacterium]|nr:ATP-binding cassette domain-containing protein [Myxococcaceae bacterium]MCI0669201.1 ATP-binding cassette domain-containing protein [Myxococcaceae bacterium]